MMPASSPALSSYQKKADINHEHGVYLVQHQETGKFYVQKTLHVYNSAVFRQLAEHPVPGIPRIYEIAEENSSLVLIEEYIPGVTLQELLDTEGSLPETQVIAYAVQLCGILHSLHSCTPPIVHRDIKPSNIMLTPDGIIKLLDLNAARYAFDTAGKDTVLMGTPGFAAPEQYGFGSSDAQTDLYALGILMNLLISGKLSHECTVSGPLAPIIRKCLMMDRAKRYSSALEVRKALEKLQQSKSAPPSESRRNSFLPPGFRSGNPLSMLSAAIGYLIVTWVSLTLKVPGAAPHMQNFERAITFLYLTGVILFSGNYKNVQARVPLCRSQKAVLRILGILLVDVLFLFLCGIILTIYESIFT